LSTSFEGDRNLKEFIKDFSSFSGSFVIGGGLEFPKGIYLIGKLKIPNEIFKLIKSKNDPNSNNDELSSNFLKGVRCLNANFLEFNVGIDILKLIK
jgi:hypothetical protein